MEGTKPLKNLFGSLLCKIGTKDILTYKMPYLLTVQSNNYF